MDDKEYNARQLISELPSSKRGQIVKDQLDAAAIIAEWLEKNDEAKAMFIKWHIENMQ